MHPGDLLSKKLVYGLLALGLLCGPHPAVGWCADEPKADPAPTKEESVPPASRKQGPRQPGDDSLRDLDPPGGETSPLARSPGAAHFLAGKIHEKRAARDDDELDKAIDCYRRAIEADPKLIQAYSALVKWYLVKQNRADAKKYALMAGEQSPLGIEIIRRYAMEVALRQNELPEAITVLTDALKLPQLDQKSLQYWLVQRDLGKFLHLNQQPQEAAEHYQQLFATVQAKDGLYSCSRSRSSN